MAKNITGQARKPLTNPHCTAKPGAVNRDRLASPVSTWPVDLVNSMLLDSNVALRAIVAPCADGGVVGFGGSWWGPPVGEAIGVILGVFDQEHTCGVATDGPVPVCPVRPVGRVPCRKVSISSAMPSAG